MLYIKRLLEAESIPDSKEFIMKIKEIYF